MAACLPAQGRVQVEAAACLRSLLGRVQVAAAACLQSLRVHRQSCQAEAVAAGHSPNLLLLQAAVAFLAARQAVVVVVVAFLRRRTLACTRIERKSVHEATRGDVRFKFHCRAAPTLSLTGAVNGAPLCAAPPQARYFHLRDGATCLITLSSRLASTTALLTPLALP